VVRLFGHDMSRDVYDTSIRLRDAVPLHEIVSLFLLILARRGMNVEDEMPPDESMCVRVCVR
jgi:hypothetical protein